MRGKKKKKKHQPEPFKKDKLRGQFLLIYFCQRNDYRKPKRLFHTEQDIVLKATSTLWKEVLKCHSCAWSHRPPPSALQQRGTQKEGSGKPFLRGDGKTCLGVPMMHFLQQCHATNRSRNKILLRALWRGRGGVRVVHTQAGFLWDFL